MKRCIACLLAVVYLFAVGAPAYAAISCECVSPFSGTHVCCVHCEHNDRIAQAGPCLEAPCCGDRHSTDISLYTGSLQDGERHAKRLAVAELPPALAAEPPLSVGDLLPAGGDRVAVWGVGMVPDAHVAACGLRAPPVLV